MDHWPQGGIHHVSARSVASASVPSASISASNPGSETTPTIFPALRNAVIHGSTFHIHTSASSTSKGFEILYGNIAAGTFHNSDERLTLDPP